MDRDWDRTVECHFGKIDLGWMVLWLQNTMNVSGLGSPVLLGNSRHDTAYKDRDWSRAKSQNRMDLAPLSSRSNEH